MYNRTLITEYSIIILLCLRISSEIKCSVRNRNGYKVTIATVHPGLKGDGWCSNLVGIIPIRLGPSPLNKAVRPSV